MEEPDYLVNQSSQTCLSVVRGSTPHDAVLAMARCSGTIKQQWFFIRGQWQWGGNRFFCLDFDPRNDRLVLRECARSSTIWQHDAQGRVATGSRALDVPWGKPRTAVILYPKHEGMNQKWWTFSSLKSSLGGTSSVSLEGLPPRVLEICHRESQAQRCAPSQLASSAPLCQCMGKGNSNEVPEYLISQSTNTCLTVLSGSGPQDAVIGLAAYDASVRQQWVVRGGQWQWAGNRAFCLSPGVSGQDLSLDNCGSSSVFWSIDEEGIFGIESHALDVPWEEPRSRVILYPVHGGENQKWWTISLISMLLENEKARRRLPKEAQRIHMIEAEKRKRSDTHDGKKDAKCSCHCQAKTKSLMSQFSSVGANLPDYLISQSTNTCLTVLSGSGPQDAVIGLADYDGSMRQQWVVQGGQWQWAGNRAFCLSPSVTGQGLTLADSGASLIFWVISEDGIFGTESRALDVPWDEPRTKVILYPTHGGQNQKWWRLSTLKASDKCVKYPIACTDTDTYKQEMAKIIVNKLSHVSKPLPHSLDLDTFPGKVAKTTPRCSRTFTLDLTVLGQASNLRMTCPEDWQATDVYVPAGDVIHVILPESLSEERAAQITVRVGAQRDSLSPSSSNVVGQKKFKRCPVVSEEFELSPGKNSLRSQFGGNLIFTFEEGENFTTTVEVHNVVMAPYYIMGQTSLSQWAKMKELDAPYSVLESEKVIVVAPTKAAQRLADPRELMCRYDDIIRKLESLSGFGPNDPPPRGKQWLVDDVQISAGSAHAGFPAMFDRQYYDLTSLSTPHDWVSWHELGHNYQQPGWWSYTYGCESTVNLFSCYIEEELGAGNRLKRENRYADTAAAVDKGLTFEAADCWQKLIFLMEIRNAFPNPGWDMFRNIKRAVRALSPQQANQLAAKEQRKLDFVYKALSRSVRADLILHYQRWGINISPDAQQEIQREGLRKAPRDLTGRQGSRGF